MKIATPAPRSGQAMLEFAVICLVLTGLMAAILGLGLMLFQGMAQQSAAESAARLLNEKLSEEDFDDLRTALKSSIRFPPHGLYDPARLVISEADWFDPVFMDQLPELNRLLRAAFVYDIERAEYRFPGTLVHFDDGSIEYDTVLIPVLNADKTEISEFLEPVVVELSQDQPSAGLGKVAINYPAQSGALIEYIKIGEERWEPSYVNDEALSENLTDPTLPEHYSLVVDVSSGVGTHTGQFGLGELYAYKSSVRPFRKVLTLESSFEVSSKLWLYELDAVAHAMEPVEIANASAEPEQFRLRIGVKPSPSRALAQLEETLSTQPGTIFRVPASGTWEVTGAARSDGGNWDPGDEWQLRLFKNNDWVDTLATYTATTMHTLAVEARGSCFVTCDTDDVLEVRIFQTSGDIVALQSASVPLEPLANWVSFTKLSGN